MIMQEIYLPVIILALVTVFLILFFYFETKRREKLAAFAKGLGFDFYKKGNTKLLDHLNHFHLFSQGHSRKIKNLIYGEKDDVIMGIFGYQYTTGGGKSSHTSRQTVLYISSPQMELPQFVIRPENIFHRIGASFGYQDIDFPGHEAFSKQFLVRGRNEMAIKSMLNEKILDYCVNKGKICTEGKNDQLIVYYQKKRIKPELLQSFIKEGLELFQLYRDAGEKD